MKTKIVIAAVLAVLTITNLNAQTSKVSFGVRAGVNFQNLTGKDSDGGKYQNKLKPGINIGANAEIPLATDFYIQPGILFSTKGSISKNVNDLKTNLSYIEIPVNFLYKPVLGAGKLLLGFGPYMGVAVAGKQKLNGESDDIEFGKQTDELKRFDAGANFLAGYEFTNRLSFQLNAGLGLVNLANRPQEDNKSSLKNTGFGVSAGYRFN